MANAISQRIRAAAVCGRLLLAVSLWQAPVPWGHQHSPEAAGLAAHIARFHAGEANAWTLGWHWHLFLPHCGLPSPADDAREPQQAFPPNAVTVAGSTFSPGASAELAAMTPAAVTNARATVDLSGNCESPVTDSAAPSARQLLCRLRC